MERQLQQSDKLVLFFKFKGGTLVGSLGGCSYGDAHQLIAGFAEQCSK